MANNLHKDHRKRVKARYLSLGLDAFTGHNILEFLLFFAIPQKDTNEIAHQLMNQFGSFSAVLDASLDELMEVDGIGEHAAILLHLIPDLARAYLEDKAEPHQKYDTPQKLMEFFKPKFIGLKQEVLYAVCLDNTNHMVSCTKLAEGFSDSVSLPIEEIVKFSFRYNAKNIILAHNHPFGLANPSASDQISTIELKKALSALNIYLIDHIIVGKNLDALSMREYGCLEEFVDQDWTYLASSK
ncbi:JAB domain-containing protein [Massilioclostridium coli]|uniref:JAB domain-containing protein n=1 Tax=Massilioclostridium coli TaxID=1870991 RepID=UPI00085CCA20|nr:DNA repair protein RadC [Massilioclostridium coli]